MSSYPYAETHDVIRGMPSEGRARDSIIAELEQLAHDEDRMWETGKCSGTMYCGDHSHYDFMNEAFGLYAHVNALQRDMCPSQTRYEGEIARDDLDAEPKKTTLRFEPDAEQRALFTDRHRQFEAAYAALLPISEALA